MENSSSSSELQKLIEAITISEVVEGRTELIAKLADLHLSEQSDVKSLAESLIASIWCGKHLKMTVMSTEESPEEEHCSLFFQLLLDFLSFSASSFSSMARYSVVTDKESMEVVEKFILEQLNLTKGAISEIKEIQNIVVLEGAFDGSVVVQLVYGFRVFQI